ncbi:hypothetical protein [Methanogenium organophilum]|uniref:Uncharacterized protein n=1 Tax=Methanogenium organophilum TaxID=2199 RepID=A0A9X9T6J7_METOG|nr:hypothetical protein [Methanogenium organophilum]WAI00443.1 hypothetical protein OU421_08360 [Methanogenium organophilum]
MGGFSPVKIGCHCRMKGKGGVAPLPAGPTPAGRQVAGGGTSLPLLL